MGVLERLFNIARANTLEYVESLEKYLGTEREREYSFSYDFEDETFTGSSSSYERTGSTGTGSGRPSGNYSGYPKDVLEAFATFDIKPPSSMKEIKNARNREIKKYHSDKFMNDPEKLAASKEIMQIYNAAYDRLKEYYKNG